jgi:hypothetical protein
VQHRAIVGGTEGFLKCTIFVFSKFSFNALCLHHVLRISISNCKSFSFSAINTISSAYLFSSRMCN